MAEEIDAFLAAQGGGSPPGEAQPPPGTAEDAASRTARAAGLAELPPPPATIVFQRVKQASGESVTLRVRLLSGWKGGIELLRLA